MSAEIASPRPEQLKSSVDLDLRDLRQAALKRIQIIASVIAWLVLLDASWKGDINSPLFIGFFVLSAAVFASILLMRVQNGFSGFVLSLGFVAVYLVFIVIYKSYFYIYIGGIIFVILYSILTPMERFAIFFVIAAGLIGLSMGNQIDAQQIQSGFLHILIAAGATWISQKHYRLVVDWAGNSSMSAQMLRDELRLRQGQVNRTMRAMQRANEQLASANARLVEARRTAEQAQAAKSQFAASISHELRTPLNLIIGFSEILYTAPQDYGNVVLSPEFLQDLSTVHSAAVHLQSLVDDILDITALDTGRLTMKTESTSLSQVARDAVDTVAGLARARGLCLVQEIDDVPAISGDRLRIKQVILNLLSNALRYTPSGTITVTVGATPEKVHCTVSDTGPGIPIEMQEKVFKEFEKLDGSESGSEKGSGLGLAISRRLIEEHGGEIHVTSQPGHGSSFAFTIPIRDELRRSDALPIHSRDSSQAEPDQLIVVITHSLSAARLVARAFGDYQCVATSDVERAMEYVEHSQPQVVLIDSQLCHDDALTELADRLAGVAIRRDMAIIACSLPGQPWLSRFPMVRSVLSKPVRRQDLLMTIDMIQRQIRSILVVDDEEDFRRLYSRFLRDRPTGPVTIRTASNGQEALAAVLRDPPDIIILDLLMPVMDGQSFLEALAATPFCDIPVIIVSGHGLVNGQIATQRWIKLRTAGASDSGRILEEMGRLVATLQKSAAAGQETGQQI